MKTKYRFFISPIVGFALLIVSSCSLDIDNVNAPTDNEVLNSRSGLIALSVGMRQIYATSVLEAIVLTPGTTARELRGITTFTNIIEIDQGGTSLPNFNGNITSVWQRPLRVMAMAENIINNAPTIIASDAAMLSGVVAHAKLLKAMCLGGLAQSFTHGIVETSLLSNASFVTRDELLSEAILLLQEAQQSLITTPPSAEFFTFVTGTEFNLPNTISAYLARYALMNGEYAVAINAAKSVTPTIASRFVYTNLAPNPLYQQVQISKNFAPRDKFGLPAELVETGDLRLAFYFTDATTNIQDDPIDVLKGFATAIDQPIPAYLPDEMQLIIAEATIRNSGDLNDAVTAINAVRTQTTGDAFNVNAGLPVYSGAVTADALLLEVYKQRCSELYLSGLRLEDSRRFGRTEPPVNVNPVPVSPERSRNFYPFPLQERQNNPNIPADPTI